MYQYLCSRCNSSPGGDDDVQCHIRHNRPVGIQQQSFTIGVNNTPPVTLLYGLIELTSKESETIAK